MTDDLDDDLELHLRLRLFAQERGLRTTVRRLQATHLPWRPRRATRAAAVR